MIEWLCKAFGFEKHAAHDCATHSTQTKAAGTETVGDLETRDHDGSGYSARDPEGHLWSFGNYEPRAERTA